MTLLDCRFGIVAQGLGQVSASVAPGLYTVRFETGPAIEERIVELRENEAQLVQQGSTPAFPSAVPLEGTSRTHETHMALAAKVSRGQPHVLGTKAELLVCSRVWMRDEERTDDVTPPSAGLRLLSTDGLELLDFDRPDIGERIAGSRAADAAWAARLALDPGSYVLEVRVGADGLRQTLVATEGWQTQIFLLQRPLAIDPDAPSVRRADLASASIHMHRPQAGFMPSAREERWTELLRRTLFLGNELSERDLERTFMKKFENPMLGLLAGHVLVRSRTIDADRKRSTLVEVLSNLQGLGLGLHPDFRALELWLGRISPFESPPMLLASWEILMRESVAHPELVPEGSQTEAIARNLWGAGPWLLWSEAAASSAAAIAMPESLFLESTAAGPLSAPSVPSSRLLADEGFDREVARQLARASRVHYRPRVARELVASEGAYDELSSQPSREAMAAVAANLGVPFGEIQRAVNRLTARPSVRKGEPAMSSGVTKERAARVAEFVRGLFPGQGNEEAHAEHADDVRAKYLETSGAKPEQVEAAVRGLSTARAGAVPDPSDVEFLEAIILKTECPTLAIFEDDLADAPKGRWSRLANDRAWLKDVIRSAGRVDCADLPAPYAGSGFLVAPDLVLTNRHVARLFASGTGTTDQLNNFFAAEVDYRREKAAPGVRVPTQVTRVELIHPYWDVALLRVRPLDGRVPLILTGTPPAVLDNRSIAVIGYPFFQFIGSEYELKVLLDNFGDTPGFKRLQPGMLTQRIDYVPESQEWPTVSALGHKASTLGGNSGSVVVDLDTRKVVGVHFAGQPLVTNWCVPSWELFRDPRFRDLGVQFDAQGAAPAPDPEVEKLWTALRGKTSMVSVPNTGEQTPAPPSAPASVTKAGAGVSFPAGTSARSNAQAGVSIVINVLDNEIQSLHIERGARQAAVISDARDLSQRPLASGAIETTAIDPDWGTRRGYLNDFLGTQVEPPRLSAAQQKSSVVVPKKYRQSQNNSFLLPYHHYSVAFNAKRRLAWFSAANIDGDRRFKFDRGKDKWFIDTRIDDPDQPVFQMGEELYATAQTDRGHLTRYLDVAWGDTKEEAIDATNDTFHFSNCALQLSDFNQSKNRWQGLEQFLLEQKARKEQRRINVFTGPVFKRTDPVYRNKFMDYSVRVPLTFWKVCTLVREDDSLSATAFLLGQPDITDLPGFEEKFDVGASQVTLAHLEKITGLDFDHLKKYDHLAQSGKDALGTLESLNVVVGNVSSPVIVLRDPEQIVA